MRFGTGLEQLQPIFYANKMLKILSYVMTERRDKD
jgi:hypothetical protein